MIPCTFGLLVTSSPITLAQDRVIGPLARHGDAGRTYRITLDCRPPVVALLPPSFSPSISFSLIGLDLTKDASGATTHGLFS